MARTAARARDEVARTSPRLIGVIHDLRSAERRERNVALGVRLVAHCAPPWRLDRRATDVPMDSARNSNRIGPDSPPGSCPTIGQPCGDAQPVSKARRCPGAVAMKTGLGKAIELPRLFGAEMHENPYRGLPEASRDRSRALGTITLGRGADPPRRRGLGAQEPVLRPRIAMLRSGSGDAGFDALWDALAALMSSVTSPTTRVSAPSSRRPSTGPPSSNGLAPRSSAGSARSWRRASRERQYRPLRRDFRGAACPSSSSRSWSASPRPTSASSAGATTSRSSGARL